MMNRRKLLLGAGPALAVTPTAALGTPAPRSPRERIEAAMVEIGAALGELYPDNHRSRHASLRIDTGLVVLGACPHKGYEARGFFSDDPPGWSPTAQQLPTS